MKNYINFKSYSIVFLYDSYGEIVGQAKVDKEDIKRVSNYNWSLANSGYAVAWIDGKTTTMQQFIHGKPQGKNVIDHINSDRLDNRRENLREVSRSLNTLLSAKCNSNTGRKGVSYLKDKNRYTAKIQIDGKSITLGYTKDFMEAVKLREEAEKKYIQELMIGVQQKQEQI